MIDKHDIEYALLLRVVQEQSFETLLKHDITADFFSDAGRLVYNHIEDYLDKYSEYMHVNNILKTFDIDPEYFTDLMTIGNLDFLIKSLKDRHASEEIRNELSLLNGDVAMVDLQPMDFIKKFDATNEKLKLVGIEKKSVNLLDDLDNILQLDRNNVIKTGFKELDDKLIGWSKGEEMIILMGRPRTR